METPRSFVDAKFIDETVHLDGCEFKGCHFERCILIYSGGDPFILAGSTLNGCDIAFEGAARRTLEQMAAMYKFGYAPWVEGIFQRVRDPFGDSTMQ